MCSIFGAIGSPSSHDFNLMRNLAKDRGRDGGEIETFTTRDGRRIILGNWRATPTTELESSQANLQPYHGVVHNGTIANDKELGGKEGEIDSEVLPRILDRSSLKRFAKSLEKIVGSYAIAIQTDTTVFLGTNYKPIYYYRESCEDGDDTVYFSSMERHLEGIVRSGHRACRVEPYSCIDLSTFEKITLSRKCSKKAIVVASSGLDSTVVASKLLSEGYEILLLHFMYGCRAEYKEVNCLARIGYKLKCQGKILTIPYNSMRGSSPLLTSTSAIAQDVSGVEYAHEWVPARNLVMIAMAVAFAEANGYHYVALGNNLEEAGAYPDNEEEFTNLLNQAMPYATQNGYQVSIISPVGHLMKHEIVKLGAELKTPFEDTWSCYHAGKKHCGKCGPCYMRKVAFQRNGIPDPTDYEV